MNVEEKEEWEATPIKADDASNKTQKDAKMESTGTLKNTTHQIK